MCFKYLILQSKNLKKNILKLSRFTFITILYRTPAIHF